MRFQNPDDEVPDEEDEPVTLSLDSASVAALRKWIDETGREPMSSEPTTHGQRLAFLIDALIGHRISQMRQHTEEGMKYHDDFADGSSCKSRHWSMTTTARY